MIAIATETLDFWGVDFSSTLGLLIPTFSLPIAPAALAGPPSVRLKRSPTTSSSKLPEKIRIFGISLSPVTFLAQPTLSSELLHTL